MTLFAVLEMYKQGELTWTQDAPFAEIRIEPAWATSSRGGSGRRPDR